MDFIYQQIGLEDPTLQEVAESIFEALHDQLHGYADNGPVNLHMANTAHTTLNSILSLLQEQGILLYGDSDKSNKEPGRYTVAIINRYKFELLSAELIWLARPEQEKELNDNTAPYEDDLVYYDIATGDMLFNGMFKTLDGRNKKLFDALFIAAPKPVDRKTLLRIARTGKYAYEPPESVVSEAITNLRKICGVKARALPLSAGGGRRLNASTYPLSVQLPRYWMSFENYRYKSRKELFSPQS